MQSIEDVSKEMLFSFTGRTITHPFAMSSKKGNQMMAKKPDGGETKTALSWKRTDSMQT